MKSSEDLANEKFIDKKLAALVYEEQEIIVSNLKEKFGDKAWHLECFKNEKITIVKGVTKLGVIGFVAIDEVTGLIVSAHRLRKNVEADIAKRSSVFYAELKNQYRREVIECKKSQF